MNCSSIQDRQDSVNGFPTSAGCVALYRNFIRAICIGVMAFQKAAP